MVEILTEQSEAWEIASEGGGVDEGMAAEGMRALGDMLAEDVEREDSRVGGLQGEESDADGEDDAFGEVFGDDDEEHKKMRKKVRGELASELRKMAAGYQDAVRGVVYSQLSRGKYLHESPAEEKPVQESVFHCGKVFHVMDLEEAGGLFGALAKGNVVAKVVAATGIGKSTKLSAKIASRLSCRVLHVAPDSVAKKEHALRMRSLVKGGVTRIWREDKVESLVMVTPAELLGRFFGRYYEDVFRMFDVIYVDEAHLPIAEMYAIRAAISTFAKGRVSFLMASATMAGEADLQSSLAAPVYHPRRIEEIVNDPGFLTGSYAVDRTAMIIESDERALAVARALEDHGVKVYTLLNNADERDFEEVYRGLETETGNLRILVMHCRFGFGVNLPIARVVTTGLYSFVAVQDGAFVQKARPLSDEEIKQHLARSKRGIVSDSAIGVVLLPEGRIPSLTSLREDEKLRTFVYLTAMGIAPGPMLKSAAASVLPYGLTQRVAVSVLKVAGLPVELVVRYLAADGRFPAAYAKALQYYATVDPMMAVSKYKEPLAFSSWKSVSTFGVLGKDIGDVVKVPAEAEGELEAIMVFISASATGVFEPEPTYTMTLSGYDSGPERKGRAVRTVATPHRFKERRRLPELVVETDMSEDLGYAFEVSKDDMVKFGRRAAVCLPGGVLLQDGVQEPFSLGRCIPEEYSGPNGTVYVKVRYEGGSSVLCHSPGGSEAMAIPKEIWECMSQGLPLSAKQFERLMRRATTSVERFVDSTLFANWGNPWLSFLKTLATEDVMGYVRSRNASEFVFAILGRLWRRYVEGMRLAVANSHQVSSFWERLVTRYKGTRALTTIARIRGDDKSAHIAQSKAFHMRLYDIRTAFATVLSEAERQGMFMPEAVSSLQQILPISRSLEGFDQVRYGEALPSHRYNKVGFGMEIYDEVEFGSTSSVSGARGHVRNDSGVDFEESRHGGRHVKQGSVGRVDVRTLVESSRPVRPTLEYDVDTGVLK